MASVLYRAGEPTRVTPSGGVGRLFDEHADAIFAYAARRVGVAAAHEVVSDVFLIALERFATFRPDMGTERGWLFGIANNALRRHWRSEQRRLRALERERDGVPSVIDPMLVVDARVDAKRDVARVVELVIGLDADDRDLLVMLAWEQMSYREIAVALAVPIGTVRSRLHRLRRLFGRKYRRYADD